MQALFSFDQVADTFEISKDNHYPRSSCTNSSGLDGTRIQHGIKDNGASGWEVILQSSRNKLMHSINGNTRLILDHNLLNLNSFLPYPRNQLGQYYSRSTLLSFRCTSTQDENHTLPTATPILCFAPSADPPIKIFSNTGQVFFNKKPKSHRPHPIREFKNSAMSRSPPPRGVPGTPSWGLRRVSKPN